MKSVFSTIVAMLVLSLSALGVATASAHEIRVPSLESPYAIPPLVRLTGTLIPAGKKGDSGLDTLGVWMDGKEWTFKLTNVETLTGTKYGPIILSDLFPRKVRFMGPDKLLGSIQDATNAGRPVYVEGRLYIANRNFLVTAEGEPAAKGE